MRRPDATAPVDAGDTFDAPACVFSASPPPVDAGSDRIRLRGPRSPLGVSPAECVVDTGAFTSSECSAMCPPTLADGGAGVVACSLLTTQTSDGGISIECTYCGATRPPAPRDTLSPSTVTSVGASHQGALSHRALLRCGGCARGGRPWVAFRTLARELEAHGAPRRLSRAARRAAKDEVRHTLAMVRLAARSGAQVTRPVIASKPVRSLEAMAMENAVEGCVRETYGAATATLQSRRARSPRARRAFARIATEEVGHAELSWRVARWLHGRLDEPARARVAAAKEQALTDLAAEIVSSAPDALVARQLGEPEPVEALAMLQALRRDLWRVAPPSIL